MGELRWHRGRRYQGWIHCEFEPPEKLLEYPESVDDLPKAEHLLDCRARQIFRLPLIVRGQPRRCWTYYFNNTSLNRSIQPAYAFRVLRTSYKLRQQGINTLKVLAALKKKGELLNYHSLLITEEVPGVHEMVSEGPHVFQIHPTVGFSPSIANGLARYLAMFHSKSFFHGDLKTRHILVQQDRNSDHRFYFVDLEKCRHRWFLPGRFKDILAARDLIQLFSSLPADAQELKEQFLEDYTRALKLSSSRKIWLSKILALYDPGRGLKQGETILANLWNRIRQ